MPVSPRLTVPVVAALLAAVSPPARADERAKLNACEVLVDRAAQPQNAGTATRPDDPELLRCRQIIREWTLRDSRMSVDEHGRPLR
jgi:hypothetical protein